MPSDHPPRTAPARWRLAGSGLAGSGLAEWGVAKWRLAKGRVLAASAAAAILGADAVAQIDPPELVSRLRDTPASRVEPGLPDTPFDDWLRQQLPPGAPPAFRTRPCERNGGTCAVIEVHVPSRARILQLECQLDPPRFLGGTVSDLSGRPQRGIGSLATLADHLAAPIRPAPLRCPESTRNVLREDDTGVHEWCQDARGRKHGPARSWYAVGRRLMRRGRYDQDAPAGIWLECDRSERCRTRVHP